MKKSGTSARGSASGVGRPSGSPTEIPRCRSPPKLVAPEDRKIWEFFCGILEHGRLTPEYQDHLLGTYMENFKASVTHLSATGRVDTSLEYFEKYGDTVVNLCINWWIATMHPDLVSVHVGASILSAVKGTKYLGIVGDQKGWRDVMIIDPRVTERLKFLAGKTKAFTATEKHPEGDIAKLKEYDKIAEDAVEAFFGCLTMTMLQDGQTFGAAIEVANNIFFWMLNTTYFDDSGVPGLDINKDLDPATTLRDLYQNKNELGWNLDTGVTKEVRNFHRDPETGLSIPDAFRHVIYHWVGVPINKTGDVRQDYTAKNRRVLYIGNWSFDEGESKKKAAQEALKLLAEGKENVYRMVDGEYIFVKQNDLGERHTIKHPPRKNDATKKRKDVYGVYILDKHGPDGMKPDKQRKPKKGQVFVDRPKFNRPQEDYPDDENPDRSSYRPHRGGRGGFSDRGRGGYSGRGRGGFGNRPEPFVPKKYLEE